MDGTVICDSLDGRPALAGAGDGDVATGLGGVIGVERGAETTGALAAAGAGWALALAGFAAGEGLALGGATGTACALVTLAGAADLTGGAAFDGALRAPLAAGLVVGLAVGFAGAALAAAFTGATLAAGWVFAAGFVEADRVATGFAGAWVTG